MNADSHEEILLGELLKIEKHEDRMITAMVKLSASNERLNQRLTGLTWVMLALTWITFVISVPNTLATVFGIPKVSEALSLEIMIAVLIISTAAALLVVATPGSSLSLSNLERRLRRKSEEASEPVSFFPIDQILREEPEPQKSPEKPEEEAGSVHPSNSSSK